MANPRNTNNPLGSLFSFLIMFIAVSLAVQLFQYYWAKAQNGSTLEIPYSDLMIQAQAQNIESVNVYTSGKVKGKFRRPIKDKFAFTSYAGSNVSEGLGDKIYSLNPETEVFSTDDTTPSAWTGFLTSWLPMLLLIGFWIFFMRKMNPGGGGALSFGKSKAKLLKPSDKSVTFRDVAGVDEAQEELHEIIEFLREPQKFQKLGGRIPKGVLLMGPPGTGKTLLARAVAGEAKVPFFSISGSDFVEMFVGVGASRVRDLFEQGQKNAPCIIFIDEIDAVGRQRGAGLGGGHDEREQTLNQLLVEMDGFNSTEGVILVAATNRPDVLDPALLRPGRFDRRVVVNKPDIKGREEILKIHVRSVPTSDNFDPRVIARGTPGFAGADLANLVNEAALNASRSNKTAVDMIDFEFAKDKALMGAERRSMIITESEKKITAIHEAGHALLAVLLPNADPVHKVTIIPRGMALGLTVMLPTDDQHNYSEDQLKDKIAVLYGGRIAEEILNRSKTTGASSDFERATELAREMVCRFGMSKDLGPLTFGQKEQEIFLGRNMQQVSNYSEAIALRIDQEIRDIVEAQYERATDLLTEKRDTLQKIADELFIRESLDGEQVNKIVRGEPLDEINPQ